MNNVLEPDSVRFWPTWVAAASLTLGFVAAAGLIALRRRSKDGPPGARLNFPPDLQ